MNKKINPMINFDVMDKIGEIEIRVIGKSGNFDFSPSNYDIKHIGRILQNVKDLLYPNNKEDRPLITYDLNEGSVRHVFKTAMQYVIGFNAVLAQVEDSKSIDFQDVKTARAFENIQALAKEKNYEFQFKTAALLNSSLRGRLFTQWSMLPAK